MTPIAKIAVVGRREFDDYARLVEECDKFIAARGLTRVIIISGGAPGADRLAERYAAARNYPVEVYRAKWGQLGKAAGFIRNGEMAKASTHGIAFWDGRSKGTRQMIFQLKHYKLDYHVVHYTAAAKAARAGFLAEAGPTRE
jgi:hypothetical protein